MEIVWQSAGVFRAFVHEDVPGVCLVSNTVAVDGSAFVVDDAMVIGLDHDRRVCDVEVTSRNVSPLMQPPRLPAAAGEEDVKALVQLRDPVRWSFNHESGAIQIEVGGDVDKATWHRLGQNRVWIGISEHGNLRGVFCSGVTFDPKGQAEEQWLDHIGAQ